MTQTTRALVQANGQPHYGIVPTPWEQINYLDYDYRSPMGKRKPKWAKHLNYNHFQYFGVISDDILFGCAFVNMRIGVVVFCYAYSPKTDALIEWQFKDIGWLFSHTSHSPTEGISHFKRGKHRIEYRNTRNEKGELEKRLLVSFGTELNVDVSLSETDFNPMCITTPIGANGWVYAQKVAGVPCTGHIKCALGHFELGDSEHSASQSTANTSNNSQNNQAKQPIQAYAHHDWSGGYMRRETVWQWACFSGEQNDKVLGLNLSCGVNETSFTENCYWINGELYKVDTVQFKFDRDKPTQPWRIRSYDGQIDLTFYPKGHHKEKQNFGYIASNFKQLFGHFEGRISTPKGDEIIIKRQYGFVEDQYAKW